MKVALAPLIGDARGSSGGLSMYLTRAGLVAGVRKTPFQPLTPAQFLVRASLATLSQTWRTPAMNAYRAGWITLAANYPYQDIFGVTRKLSGSAMFAKLNRNLTTVGIAALFIPPTTLACPAPGLLTLSYTAGSPPTFTVDANTEPTSNECVVIRCTKPLSAGVQTTANTETVIQTFPPGTVGPWDISTNYHAKHSTVASNTQIFVLVNFVNKNTGYAGQQSIDALLTP